ncbi:putative kinase [Klebsiella pneumoniae]|nr:putative kinase [Klebsiella pneumoniae]
MAFTPPLGSTSPEVLLDNATRLDKLVNGPEATIPDRAGEPLDSWRRQQKKVDDTLVNFQENGGAMGFSSLQELLAFTPDKANVLAVDTSTGEQYLWNGTEWVPSEYQVNKQIKSLNEIVEKSHSTKFFHRWKDRIGTIIAGWKNDDVGGVYFLSRLLKFGPNGFFGAGMQLSENEISNKTIAFKKGLDGKIRIFDKRGVMLASIENGKLQMAKMNIETMLQLAVKSGNTSLTIKKDGKGISVSDKRGVVCFRIDERGYVHGNFVNKGGSATPVLTEEQIIQQLETSAFAKQSNRFNKIFSCSPKSRKKVKVILVYGQSFAAGGRLLSRPTSYAGISTIGITVETGGQLAAQSDKRVSVVATRNYDGGGDRTISGAFLHLARSLGYRDDQIDIAALSTLEDTYWTPRGEYFDHQASSDSTSAKDIFDKIAEAGMGYFLLSDGLLSVGREGVKSWTGIITPQDTVEEMQTSFRVPSEDDFDGVDVKYINPVTWAEETVQCRTPENPFPRKTEAYTIDVAMTADRAWRIGMRRLMKYLHQRRTYTATTSMLGWCHDFGDHIILSDDIRTGKTQSCLIDAMIYDFQEITLHVTEPLDWSYANPRCWIQFQDGRPSSRMLTPQRVDDFTLTVPYNDDLHPGDWIMDDPEIDLPKLLFCDSEKGARHGIVQEVAPSGDSNCQITAPEYKEIYYLYDDATYPGDAA